MGQKHLDLRSLPTEQENARAALGHGSKVLKCWSLEEPRNYSAGSGVDTMARAHMGTRTPNWATFVSLFLILTLVFAAAHETPNGLSVKIAYQTNQCDGRTTVVRVLGNGNVRVLDDRVQQDVRPSELADRLREIFKSRSEQVLFLMADSNLPFQTVAEIIDTSQKLVDFVAVVTPSVEPGYCWSIHFPPTFTDYNYIEPPVRMKPVTLWPWQ